MGGVHAHEARPAPIRCTSSGQFKAPFNQILNEHRVLTYKDTVVIAPNSDTPYSGAFLDLQAEPMVLSVPDVGLKRYYSVMLTDGSTYNYGFTGSRATGGKAGDYMVVYWPKETPPSILPPGEGTWRPPGVTRVS